jgi:hypothetical protein
MIKIIKLISGVEVAGELTKEDDYGIVLKYPLQINYKYFVSTYPSVNLSKYMMFAGEDDIHFPYSCIINIVEPRAAFEEYYIKAVAEVKSELDIMIDRQLLEMSEESSFTKEELLTALLEAMPTPELVN